MFEVGMIVAVLAEIHGLAYEAQLSSLDSSRGI